MQDACLAAANFPQHAPAHQIFAAAAARFVLSVIGCWLQGDSHEQ
jgi:hypothetical protein